MTQRIVTGPVEGTGEVILDVDRAGRLLGIEIAGTRLLPFDLADDRPTP